ncbi:LOW QUALITY PROTEIN: protein NRT1/ PTR FAMILY 5.2-like [Phalaenopsis equestris]|uniref:LOW QUALITY PROTEIN: protein NRT1/ PTR FAMILY 5.2-like n=1 Tax=Phalaenopsis equestris TaxID=78828 RepID=UPI0009E36DD6|nr:LOW QUALITY PROTEIN: protein NRT1/ PTR FAMILY 5.2-like [Phalaenopsis equestris]
MAFHSVSSNLVRYLTNKLHQGTVASSNNVTNWIGTVWIMPIVGAYIADAHFGRYWTFIIGSIICFSGMCVLTLAVSLPSLKPPPCGSGTADPNCTNKASSLQLGVFFFGLYVIALGTGGTKPKPNISTIGADQFDEFHPRERRHKISFFNWWLFSIFFGTLFSNTVIVYIQDNFGWTFGYGIPTLGLLIAILIFVTGTPLYRHKPVTGSPFMKMTQVVVAAMKMYRVSLPEDPKELYELGLHEYERNGKVPIGYTPSMRFLSKAAVKAGKSGSPWSLCSVTQVEETKQMVRMIPILIATFIPSTMLAQVNTLFIKQGTTLDRRMGSHFHIPPASLLTFVTLAMLISIALYDRAFVPFARRFTGNPRGISLLRRMGAGMLFHMLVMLVASLTERHRLSAARSHSISTKDATVPQTVFILLPQFVLMGIADAFLEPAKIEFFYDQAPEGMKSLGTSYAMTTLGVGNFLSSFLLSTTEKVTRRLDGGEGGWILNNLNKSHLDYYYAFFTVLNVVNLFFFLFVSRFYVYRAAGQSSVLRLRLLKNPIRRNPRIWMGTKTLPLVERGDPKFGVAANFAYAKYLRRSEGLLGDESVLLVVCVDVGGDVVSGGLGVHDTVGDVIYHDDDALGGLCRCWRWFLSVVMMVLLVVCVDVTVSAMVMVLMVACIDVEAGSYVPRQWCSWWSVLMLGVVLLVMMWVFVVFCDVSFQLVF